MAAPSSTAVSSRVSGGRISNLSPLETCMSWLILGVAVVTEICWALSLKWAATLATWQASSVPIVLSFVNMGLLALAMRGLPAGTAYAIWTGAGAIGVIIGGMILFGDKVSGVQAGFMALTVVGIVGTKIFAQT
jgi:quaternary ammonium compound-resistance protein SugE